MLTGLLSAKGLTKLMKLIFFLKVLNGAEKKGTKAAASANLHFTFSLFDAFQLLTSLEKSEKLKSEKAIYV